MSWAKVIPEIKRLAMKMNIEAPLDLMEHLYLSRVLLRMDKNYMMTIKKAPGGNGGFKGWGNMKSGGYFWRFPARRFMSRLKSNVTVIIESMKAPVPRIIFSMGILLRILVDTSCTF
jgi:hypothetical protein